MVKCCQCGKDCSEEISFNWIDGVRYLCSKECEKESRSWRFKKEQREQLEEIERRLRTDET